MTPASNPPLDDPAASRPGRDDAPGRTARRIALDGFQLGGRTVTIDVAPDRIHALLTDVAAPDRILGPAVRVDTVDDPQIINRRDAIIEVTSTAICGLDLHLYEAVISGLEAGDVLGHEFMGRVVEVGARSTLKVRQRVVVPFTISCGACFFCKAAQFSACDNSNPVETQEASETIFGHAVSGSFGYSHPTGGYAGGQSQYVRVPFLDMGPIVIPEGVEDEAVLFLSDILPTGWMAAENAQIRPGETVAVCGCGPVGLFSVQSALLMGAGRVIAIDHYPRWLELARNLGAKVIDDSQTHVLEARMEMTGGICPDAVMDAVGMESHGLAPDNLIDAAKQKVGTGADRAHVLRLAMMAVRKGGRVSIPGVYGGMADTFPLGTLMEKGPQIRSGQTDVQAYTPPLLARILAGEIDTTILISHRLPLEAAPEGYRTFRDKQDDWAKVILQPRGEATGSLAEALSR